MIWATVEEPKDTPECEFYHCRNRAVTLINGVPVCADHIQGEKESSDDYFSF